jgi:glycerol-3-phosphate acyltransferase PlsY
MGAMNVFYKVGIVSGLLVMAVDIGKGAAAVAMARWLGVPPITEMLAGATAVLGHGFPVWLKFRGGKGGATVIGALIFLMPWGIPIGIAIFLVLLLLTRFPTLSYSIAMLCFPFIAWLIYQHEDYVVFSLLLLLIPLIRYIPRIREMRAKAGGWRRLVMRKNLKDRF